MANTEHNPTPSQINIKCHSKSLITSMTVNTSSPAFTKKLQGILKDKKEQSEETK